MSYRVSHIASIIKAELTLKADTVIEHLLLDSRKVFAPVSSLFFAIKSIRRDGHQFIPELYKRGVRNFVVSQGMESKLYQDASFLLVTDTLDALQQLAAHHRKQFNIPVIGITGSNGKTIVKEWLYQLLHEDYNIVRSPKSYNSQIGVPLSVWSMNSQHTLAIFEAGISRPGEMENLQKIISPVIGVVTNIGEAHSEGFNDIQQKVNEKVKLLKNTKDVVFSYNHKVIGNTIDNWWEGETHAIHKQPFNRFGWGSGENAALMVTGITMNTASTTIKAFIDKEERSISIPFTDTASVENAITCWCVMCVLNISHQSIEKRMKNLQPINMRLELKKGINHCSVINDSYSADISSLEIALNFLELQSASEKKTVILSDFQQSSLPDKILYQQVLENLKKHKIGRVIGIGEKIAGEFRNLMQKQEAGLGIELYPSTDEFIHHFRSSFFKEEAILVKGARTFAFERIVQLLEQKVHQTVLEINLNAIANNLKQYQQVLKPSTKVMAMVKAFAYGSGGAEIAGILQYHKVDYLGVAYADEGVELRKAGITLPIMVMNPEENAFESITDNNLEPEIYSFEMLNLFDRYLQKEGLQQYPVHIEIETGMNRLGFATSDIGKLSRVLQSTPSIKVQSVFSHLAASEEAAQDEFTFHQYRLFEKAAKELEDTSGCTFIKHISNSAAAIRHPRLQMDMIRLGIGLYGVDSSGSSSLQLQTVATLKSTVAQLKNLKKGESVSYNRKGIVERDSVIATIRIGYADGYPRRLGNGIGKVWLKGKLAPLIGTVCMDMFMIDVTDIPGVQEGEAVIIFGDRLPVQQIAQWAETIPYEIMTGVSQRVKRVYFEE
ncbi:MAG: bifunctional UDP-N-acetylmuramoyl-tripeptide:D-alanyl-D-alanine ligase/alanine racemase [Chitinophagaceae bacterium]